MKPNRQLVIRSGGHRGADLAALDWAIANEFAHGFVYHPPPSFPSVFRDW
jgi:hypothetical protein